MCVTVILLSVRAVSYTHLDVYKRQVCYFTADGRVDFRELVKDLAGVFKMRIELRQIGVRDEAKMLGGIGSCGRALCCHSWPVSYTPLDVYKRQLHRLPKTIKLRIPQY